MVMDVALIALFKKGSGVYRDKFKIVLSAHQNNSFSLFTCTHKEL
jgi:hypothetical protein